MPLTGSFTGIGVLPRLVSVTILSQTELRLSFSEPMSNNAALITSGNYTLAEALGSAPRVVTGVVTDGNPNPTSVTVTLDGALSAGTNNYDVTAAAVSDVAGNVIDPAFDTITISGPPASAIPPFLTNHSPAVSAVDVAVGTNIQFDILDQQEGVDLSTLSVTIAENGGAPATAVTGGVIQAPFTGSITPITDGYRVVLDPATDFGQQSDISVSVTADDLAVPANTLVETYQFFTYSSSPVCVLAECRINGLLGSIIQLDARESSNPDGLPVSFEWVILQAPIGSAFVADINTINPASITDLFPSTYAAISFIPDVLGTYVIQLQAVTGGDKSDPCTALVDIGLTRTLCGSGAVPDAKFLWSFISNFYSLVDDRRYFEVAWSATLQLFGAEYVRLWSNDYNKSLDTIQETVQRRWVSYSLRTDVLSESQRLIVGSTFSGSAGNTGDIGAPGADPTAIFYTTLANDDFSNLTANYGAKGRIIEINGSYFTIFRTYNVTVSAVDYSVIVLDQQEVANSQSGIPYRIPQLLHVPGVDFEAQGVMAGDQLILEWRRSDTGLTAEMPVRIFAVDRERIGFEFVQTTLNPGDPTVDFDLFEQVVRDLKLVGPTATQTEIARAANALIAFIPIGINLSERQFTTYQVTVRASRVVHNTRRKVDSLHVSIPFLQEELKEDPSTILRENTDYILVDRVVEGVTNRYVEFSSGLFSMADPSPETLWAECVHLDNGPTIESNFGSLVELGQSDLEAKSTRAPYLASVRGLWYALTNGPTVANVRLGLQILMGLPFSTTRGRILSITSNFSTDSFGQPLGRILAEDVDDDDRVEGTRRFYFYPENVGLEDNPITGLPYAVGDIIEAFIPLSKGVTVQDYVKNPTWWLQTLAGQEVLKYFLFQAQIDTDSGVFDENDLVFSLEFIRKIKPVYTEVVAAVLQSLQDDPLDQFADVLTGEIITNFYENAGFYGGHESTVRGNDLNQQGGVLWGGNGRPFSTRSLVFLRDVVTAANGAAVEATSATGFGTHRARVAGTASTPTIEGDLLLIHPGQPGATLGSPRLYEITASSGVNGPITLGSEAPFSDPPDWDLDPPDSTLFQYGTGILATVLRRAQNPVVQGADLQTVAGAIQLANSAGSSFITDGVQLDDHLIIESGANAGEYRIVSTVVQTTPRDYTPSGVQQITATQVGLVNMDGTNPALANASGQSFRIIKPHMMKTYVEGARVVQDTGDMWVEVLDPGASSVPFDVFTPGMVGAELVVTDAENPLNNGVYTILEYSHAGYVRITTGSPQTSDATATAKIRIRSAYHHGIERASELAPSEVITAVVS